MVTFADVETASRLSLLTEILRSSVPTRWVTDEIAEYEFNEINVTVHWKNLGWANGGEPTILEWESRA